MTKKFFLFFFLLQISLAAQSLNELYDRIENKLRYDENYLDAYTIAYAPEDGAPEKIQNIPVKNNGKTSFNFKNQDGVRYFFEFLKESPEIDSVVLLRIIEEVMPSAESEGRLFGNISATQADIKKDVVVSFEDLNELYFSDREKYNALLSIVQNALEEVEPASRLNLPIEEDLMSTRGMTSSDNTDYLSYHYINSRHMYPETAKPEKRISSRRNNGASSKSFPVKVDLSFSHLTFFHEAMNFEFSAIGFEANTESQLLNLHPWQSLTANFGIRSMTAISGSQKNIKDDYIIDARILGRVPFSTDDVVTSLPFLSADPPRLNVGSGVSIDVSTTRVINLPFLNLFFSTGSEDVTNPTVTMGQGDSLRAYFNFLQWAAAMSFYWNTSEARTLRFRIDIGAGYYEVLKAEYAPDTYTDIVYNKIQPLVELSMSFVPKIKDEYNELFGASARYYDNRIKTNMWLKIMEIADIHQVRLYFSYISSPVYRSIYEWENPNSAFFGLRYRLGFN